MGANASKDNGKNAHSVHTHQKIQDLIDLGSVLPNGLYPTTQQDYDPRIVRNLIIARQLAPFYKGLPDAPEPVAEEPPKSTKLAVPVPQASSSHSSLDSKKSSDTAKLSIAGRPRSASSVGRPRQNVATLGRPRSVSQSKECRGPVVPPKERQQQSYIEKMRQREKMLYNDAVECPICFLYYPANINYSRCCDQPICTECFVQIHRPIDTPAVPATCPFCMEENYGVIYEPPPWTDKLEARARPRARAASVGGKARHTTSGISNGDEPRRKTVSYKDPAVVLVDHVRPDWKKLLVANAHPASRRNSASAGQSPNRGFLRTGTVGPLFTRPGRSASTAAATQHSQFLANMRDMNMDLEEWMVMEAIRLSLAEQEEQERRAAAEAENAENVEQNPSTSTNTSQEQLALAMPIPTIQLPTDAMAPNTASDHELSRRETRGEEDDDDDDEPLAISARIHGFQQTSSHDPLSQEPPPSNASTSSSASSTHDTKPILSSVDSPVVTISDANHHTNPDTKSPSRDKEDSDRDSQPTHAVC
ncbi:uncharacterized protein BYT42DRAFT_564695 [Radiomyces spectabilis]|uniref:uncharacterized protein n=1 Tax=Radiomyces spectabilis TaxID=64574 RepID=UPI0022211FCF|nr:uncharacterized protein BYT42DRAFT_564695 [Radiomyces spectabilis]KAI8380927.1 hypothetical protein BYT42DRAFT_564695 [Radiomyces spectabilis]